MSDKPETFSIHFEINKAGADGERLARELKEQIQSSANGGVEAELSPPSGEAPTVLTIVFARPALDTLTKAISQFLSRRATSQFEIAIEQNKILILPDMDSERIKAAILAGLPGDPAIDPPTPRKRRR